MDVKYVIVADAKGAIKEFKQVDGAVDSMRGTTERGSRALKGMWKQMAGGIVAIAGVRAALRGAKGLIGAFMDVATQTEQYEIQLKSILGTQEKATQAFTFFRDVAASLPYTLEAVIQSGTRLAAINVPFEDWLPRIADLASAMGMDLPIATDQMARALKGGLGAADLFRDKGISAMIQEFAKLEKGIDDISKISMPELQQVLWDFTERFKGASEEMSRTWKGVTSMLADKWFGFRDAVMKSQVFETLKKGLVEFNKKLDEFVESGKMDEWANNTARAVLQAFKVMIQGVQGVTAGLYILKAAWDDLNVAINLQVKRMYEKVLPAYALLAKVIPSAKEELVKLVKEYAELLIQTKGYADANEDATDKAADLINKFDDMIRFLNIAIGATKTMKTESGKLADALAGAGTGGKPSVKKAIDTLILGHDLWGKAILGTANFYKTLSDTMESYVFKPIKKKLFDLKEFWKDINEQIEASWIRGISDMIVEFKDFSGAIKQFLNTIFQMFADTIGKIVVEWVTGTIEMEEAIKAVGQAIEAFSLGVIAWIAYVATKVFGDLNKKTAQQIYLLEQQIERARRILEEAKRIGEGIEGTPGEGPEEAKSGEAPDFSNLLSRIPALLNAMLAAIGPALRKIKQVADDVWVGFTDLTRWAEVQKRLDRFSRIALASFNLMIAQGYSFYDALVALKEPLLALRDKYLEMGRQVPQALRPILEMLEKMEDRPKLYKSMSALLELFKSFATMGYMTQGLLKDFVQSTAGLVRNILGVSGNLKKALLNIGDLTKEQIMMLAPLIAPFLEAAQRFGLKLPDWIKNLAAKMGLKIEDQAIDKVPPLLDRIRQRMGRETTRIVKAIHGVERAINKIPSGQQGLDFHSGGQGGLVRYHPNERIVVTPNISVQPAAVNMNMQSTPVNIYLDSKLLAQGIAKHVLGLSRDGHWKIHRRGLVSQ